MHVRPATSADLAALLPLVAQLHPAEGIPWRPARVKPALARLLADPALGLVLLAEQAGTPSGDTLTVHATVGYAIVTYGFDLEFGGRDGYLTDLYLLPSVRGLGWGRHLLDATEAAARAAGVHTLHLQVRPENAAAVALYTRGGYHEWPRLFLSKALLPE